MKTSIDKQEIFKMNILFCSQKAGVKFSYREKGRERERERERKRE